MMVIGIVLSFVGHRFICWVAVHVRGLRAFVHCRRHGELAAYRSGSSVIGTIMIGVIAGTVALVVRQIEFVPSARHSFAL